MVQSVRSFTVRRRRARLVVPALAVAMAALLVTAAPARAESAPPPIVPTVFGHLTWSFARPVPAGASAAITAAMDEAISNLNTVAVYSGNVPVAYDATLPAARTGFGTTLEFSRTISAGVAAHEMARWLGVGTAPQFAQKVRNGVWTGSAATAMIHSFDGWQAQVHTDGSEFWPYGWRDADEYVEPQRQIALIGGFRADMGLSDGTDAATGAYRLQNRANGRLMTVNARYTDVVQRSSTRSREQRWLLEPRAGLWTIRDASAGLGLDGVGRRADGANVAYRPPTGSVSQLWEPVPTGDGWFQLRNHVSGMCLDTAAREPGAVIQSRTCSPADAGQQWRLDIGL